MGRAVGVGAVDGIAVEDQRVALVELAMLDRALVENVGQALGIDLTLA